MSIQPCTYPTGHPGSDDPECGEPATAAGPDGPLCDWHANLTRAEAIRFYGELAYVGHEPDQDID